MRPREYFELHVEQGPVLEHESRQIGVVEGVQGISWTRVVFSGAANHAGTTPTWMRRDAGYAAGLVLAGVRDIAESLKTTVGTVGNIRFEPGLINVIPSRAELTVDLRDPDEERLQEAEKRLKALLDDAAGRAEWRSPRNGLSGLLLCLLTPDWSAWWMSWLEGGVFPGGA